MGVVIVVGLKCVVLLKLFFYLLLFVVFVCSICLIFLIIDFFLLIFVILKKGRVENGKGYCIKFDIKVFYSLRFNF